MAKDEGCARLIPTPILTGLAGCWLHHLTGLYCAGCGATRAVVALLHGDWQAAIGYNALVSVVVPLAAALLGYFRFCRHKPDEHQMFHLPLRPMVIAISATLAFTFLRNLPFTPFDQLAP